MALTNTPDVSHGMVVGRFLVAGADSTSDADRKFDFQTASGKIVFKPVTEIHLNTGDGSAVVPTTIFRKAVEGELDSDGYLVDNNKVRGFYLAVGLYDVSFKLDGISAPSFRINVKPENTEAAPLDLTLTAPIPTVPGTKVVFSEETALRSEGAATLAESKAADAELAADRAEFSATNIDTIVADAVLAHTVEVGDDIVAGLVGSPGTSTNSILIGIVNNMIPAQVPASDVNVAGHIAALGSESNNAVKAIIASTDSTTTNDDVAEFISATGSPSSTAVIGLINSHATSTGDAEVAGFISNEGGNSNNAVRNIVNDLAGGLVGPMGPAGPEGPTGPAGATGAGLNIVGSLTSSSQLPGTGTSGQAYLINGNLWVWDSLDLRYEDTGTIQGPKGDTGATGPVGPASTVPGPQGLKGDKGDKGDTGTAGEGINGGRIFVQATAPTLPAPNDIWVW